MGTSMNTSSSKMSQSTSEPLQQFTKQTEIRRDFNKLFADMEFRCRRSALMNYEEAEQCDKR